MIILSFHPYTVNAEEVLEMWQAQMVISKANTQQRWDMNQLANIVSDLQEQVVSLKKKNELSSLSVFSTFVWVFLQAASSAFRTVCYICDCT